MYRAVLWRDVVGWARMCQQERR